MKKVKIGDVCEIINGYAFKSENYVDNGIRVIRITNVQKGFIEDNTPVFYPINSVSLNKYMLKENDLLISLTGNVGRVALLEKKFLPAALNQRVACLRLISDKIFKNYLFHILNSEYFEKQCIQASKGVAQKNMSTEWIKEFEIPLYSQKEQVKIVKILNGVRSIIDNRRIEIQQLDFLIKSRFVEMFKNEKEHISMSKLCSIITDGTHQPPKGIPFIFVSNISDNKITYNAGKFISQETYDELIKRTPIEIGDVLLSTVGSYGHPAVVKSDKKFLFQRHIAYLKPKKDIIDSDYLHGALLSPNIQRKIEESVKGIAQKTLNLSEIKRMSIPVPDINKQKQFATFVHQVDKLKVEEQQRLEKAQMLFDSLMQQYFG